MIQRGDGKGRTAMKIRPLKINHKIIAAFIICALMLLAVALLILRKREA